MKYSVESHLSVEEWNALAEEERVALVQQAHRDAETGRDPAAHATIHVMVENRLASGDVAANAAYDRLRASGLSRHMTIHALASVVTRHMLAMLETGAAPDEATAARDFGALTREPSRRP